MIDAKFFRSYDGYFWKQAMWSSSLGGYENERSPSPIGSSRSPGNKSFASRRVAS
jgi:hypothetical protein